MNQIDKIKQALLNGESISPVKAFKEFMCTRLAAVICQLKKQGWQICTKYDYKNRVATYKLMAGWRPDPGQLPKEKGRFANETKQP